MEIKTGIKWLCVGLGLFLWAGCSERSAQATAAESRSPVESASGSKAVATKKADPPAAEKKMTHAELVAKGRQVYMSNCTACHNMNPAQKGSLGPAVSGSSEALIEARVVHGNYPPGYTPKADTHLMVALPYLKNDIKALAAYLEN
ncbi:MAG: cytochrome c [Myxococcota bacterium]|nr:cytochrome c [Myxococcota bacterium]